MVCYRTQIINISPPSDGSPGDPELVLYITNEVKDKPREQCSFRTTIDLWNTNRSAACNDLSEKLASLGIHPNCRRPMIREIERSVRRQLEMRSDETVAFRVEIITMEQRSAPSAGEEEDETSGGGCWDEAVLVWGPKGPKFEFHFRFG